MRNRGIFRLLVLATVVAVAGLGAGEAAAQPFTEFVVNATHDAVDAAPGDGVCADAGGACTLRAAVMESNAATGQGIVHLGAGTHTLSLSGVNEDQAATGDLDITNQISIVADNAGSTIIDGAQLDRVFEVDPFSTDASAYFFEVTIRNGSAVGSKTGTSDERGGGILSHSNLDLWFSAVVDSEAGVGGGVYGEGRTSIIVTDIRNNRAVGGASGAGGGVYAEGAVVFQQSNVVDNFAASQGGGAWGASSFEVRASTFADNRTEGGPDKAGGGINSVGDLTVKWSTIARNSSARGGGIFSVGTAALEKSTVDANDATISGGGIYNEGTITINETTMSGNSLDAFSNPGSEVAPGTVGNATVINSTVSANFSGIGNGGTLALTNVTIAENTSVGLGAGTIGSVSMKNTIIGQNGAGDCTPSPGITSLGHNLDSDGTCA
jgi:CSLREA domain-containing protein